MKITVERFKNRIYLFSDYHPTIPEMCKQILGYSVVRKDGQFYAWSFPLEWGTCLELRRVFGPSLEIGDRLARWARVERKRQGHARHLAGQRAVDLAHVHGAAPALAKAMTARTYQQVGSAFIAHTKAALLADDPGLGKTLQAMGAIIEANVFGPILVVAPQTALDITWAEELRRWLPDDAVFSCTGSKAKRQAEIEKCLAYPVDRRAWLLVNYEMLRIVGANRKVGEDEWGAVTRKREPTPYPRLLGQEWASVIIDESQRVLIVPNGMKDKWPLQRQGVSVLRVARDGLKLAMSGTPYRGKIENMWGTLQWLYPDKYRSINRWLERWFESYTNTATGEVLLGDVREQSKEEFYNEIDGIILRRTKREVAPDMPPKLYAGWPLDGSDANSPVGVWLPLLPAQARSYAEMHANATAELEGGSLMANGVLAELTRLKQFSTTYMKMEQKDEDTWVARPALPSNKLEWLVEWLAERGIERGGVPVGGKVIVASQFSKIVDLFADHLKELGIATTKITGSVTGAARLQAKEDFQDPNGPRVMCLSTKAGGVSLTLDQADDVIFLDETWDPDDQTQVEDRADRVSRSGHQVTVWYLRSLATVEEAIAADNARLDELQADLLDGRRGVARAKKLLAYGSKR